MSYGLQTITNDNGEIVIDANFKNLRIVQTGTVPSNGMIYYNLPQPPLVFLRAPISSNAEVVVHYATSTQANVLPVGVAYLLAIPNEISTAGGGYGLEVRNASNGLVYSSNYQYLEIIGTASSGTLPGYLSHPYASSQDYICVGPRIVLSAYCGIAQVSRVHRASTTSIYVDIVTMSTGYTGSGASVNHGAHFIFGRIR